MTHHGYCWSLYPQLVLLLLLSWPSLAFTAALVSQDERGLLGLDSLSLSQPNLAMPAEALGENSDSNTSALPDGLYHFSPYKPMTSTPASEDIPDSELDFEMDSSDEEYTEEFTTEKPLNSYRVSWWTSPVGIARRVQRSIAQHFSSLQRNGIPYHGTVSSPEQANSAKSPGRRRSFFRRGSNRASTTNSGSTRPSILDRGIRASKYWPTTNITQTISTEDTRALNALLEFAVDSDNLEGTTGAELSIQFTHPTCLTIRPFLLFADFKYWNPERNAYGRTSREFLLSSPHIPEGKKILVFDVSKFISYVERKTSSGQVLIRFRIRRDLETRREEEEDQVTRSTFNALGNRLGEGCYSILSDSNPFHHFLRVDYTAKSPSAVPKEQVHPTLRKPEVNNIKPTFLQRHLNNRRFSDSE